MYEIKHTEFATHVNHKLDTLWEKWVFASDVADDALWENDKLNAEADAAKSLYDAAVRMAQAGIAFDVPGTYTPPAAREDVEFEREPYDDEFSAYNGDAEAYRGMHW